jgi:hypothetical protein
MTMPIRYTPQDPKLISSVALDHFTACIEAVTDEGIIGNSCNSEEADEEAIRDWLGIHGRHFDETLRRLNHAYYYERQQWYVEHDEAEAARDEHPVREDRPTQGAAIQNTSANSNDTPSDAPLSKVQRDLANLKAEFVQRFNEMEDAFARLPQFPSAEKLTQGALSLGVYVEQLRECLLQMGAV